MGQRPIPTGDIENRGLFGVILVFGPSPFPNALVYLPARKPFGVTGFFGRREIVRRGWVRDPSLRGITKTVGYWELF